MNTTFVFDYTRLDILSGTKMTHQKTVSSKTELAAQIQMLMFLNKCNSKSAGTFQYYADTLHPTVTTVGLCDD